MYNFHKRSDAVRRADRNAGGSGGAGAQRVRVGFDGQQAPSGPQTMPEGGGGDSQQQYNPEQQGYMEESYAPAKGYDDYGTEDLHAYDMTSYDDQGNDPQQQQQQQAYLQPQEYTHGNEALGEEDDAHLFADYRGPLDGERAERLNRRLQQQKQYDDIPMPSDDADPKDVFTYYRKLIGLVHFVPPRHWREIRFDLPANVAELRLYPQRRERIQDREPIRPTSCIAISLKGMLPENTTPSEYAAQMVQYMFDLLNYQNASTAITELRFVKKGTELLQMVVTLGKDTRLAGRVLTELQAAGLRAHYGKPVFEFPPNATFQVVDYRRSLHDGKGISAEEVTFLLEPIRQYNTVDINVIEGYEPGVFYAPVKRPETVYSFLWNYFCSYKFQSDLFRRYGVLVTMAQCPHEFLQKGIPYHIQKQQLEEKIRAELQRKGMLERKGGGDDGGGGGGGDDDDDDSDDGLTGDMDGVSGDGPPPAWAANAGAEVDIFSSNTPAKLVHHPPNAPSSLGQSKYGTGNNTAAATGNTVATTITFVDEDGLEDVDALLKQYNAVTEPPPSAAKKKDATAKGRKGKEVATEVPPAAATAGHGTEGGDAWPDGGPRSGTYLLPPPAVEGPGWIGGHGNHGGESYGALPTYAPEQDAFEYPQPHQPPQYYPPTAPYGGPVVDAPPESSYYGGHQANASPAPVNPYPGAAQPSSSLYPAPPYAHSAGPEALTTAAPTSAGGGGASSAYPLLVDEAEEEQDVLQQQQQQQQQQQPPSLGLWAENGNGCANGDFNEQHHQQQQLPSSTMPPMPAVHETGMLLSWSMDEGLASSAVPGYAAGVDFPVPPLHPPPPPPLPRGGGNEAEHVISGEGSGMQVCDGYWPAFGETPQQLNALENVPGGVGGGVLGDCDPTPPSYYPGNEMGNYGQPLQQAAAPWGFADDYGGAAMAYSEPMPMPPHVQEAAEIAADVEERIQAAFPSTWATASSPAAQPFLLDGEGLDDQEMWSTSEETTLVLQHIPCAAAAAVWDLPAPTTEIKELLSFLHRNVSSIGRLLHKTTTTTVEQAAEVALFRARVARALLIGATMPLGTSQSPASPEAIHAAWEPCCASGTTDDATEDVANGVERSAETQLPALLPYLLRTPSGIDLAMLLAFHYPHAFSRRFLPYAPAYLFHENVVRVVFTTALRRDPEAENVLVRCILAHWYPLMQWLLRAARHKTAAKRAGSETSVSTVAGNESGGAMNAMKHLVSSLGCTVDAVFAVLSPSQRETCRASSEAHDYVSVFAEAIRSTETQDPMEGGGAPSLLWGPDGALYRSLVRLYVNADVCDGAKVALRMLSIDRPSSSMTPASAAGAEVCLTRAHYYYCVGLLSRSHTAPVLSRETAAFCGTFVKLLELQHTRWQQRSKAVEEGDNAAAAPSVSEKEAEQLLDTVFKAMQTIDTYTALRDAYLAVDVPITRFEGVLARLSSADPSETLRLQALTLEEWYSGADINKSGGRAHHSTHPPRKRGPEVPAIPSIFYYRPPPRRNTRPALPLPPPPPPQTSQAAANATGAGVGKSASASGGKGHASIASRWRSEWTATMRTYPPCGDPFPALPEGWTSRPSRGHGHYYFSPPAPASPTYKHPVDGKECLVTPQAFLLQEAAGDVNTSGTTLDEVRTRANVLHTEEAAASGLPPPAELTTEDAKGWLSDQRRRNVFLDVSAMELLGITYRVAAPAGAEAGATAAGKRGRDAVATALTPEQLQQVLIKAIPSSYPPVGAPYPAVGRGWSVYFNSARGQYGFSGPTSGPSQPPLFVHPKTRKHYFISPQAFVQQRKVSFDVVARGAGVERKDVMSWMDDQRTRHAAIDAAVVKLIPINYSDVDKAMEANALIVDTVGESSTAAAPVASLRDRDHQHAPPPPSPSRQRPDREGRGSNSNNNRRRRRHDGGDSDASRSDDGNRDSDDNARSRHHRRRRDRSPRRRGGNRGGGGGGDRHRR